MSSARSRAIAAHIAAAIVRNRTRKQWSGLHSDAVSAVEKEIIMSKSSVVTTSMNVADSPAVREPIQTSADANAASNGQQARQPGAAGSGVTSGMGAEQNSQVRPVVVKPVDSKTLQGSYPGDHRSKAADAKMPNQPAVRQPVGQAPFSGRTPAPSAPVSVLGADSFDQN